MDLGNQGVTNVGENVRYKHTCGLPGILSYALSYLMSYMCILSYVLSYLMSYMCILSYVLSYFILCLILSYLMSYVFILCLPGCIACLSPSNLPDDSGRGDQTVTYLGRA